MSVGRLIRGALVCAVPFACGERAADPVIALPGRAESGAGAAGTGAGTTDAGQGGQGDQGQGGQGGDRATAEPGRAASGLCAACQSSSECGDADDACVLHGDESFCGRNCYDQRGCPDGYACVELNNAPLRQCVPLASCPAPAPPPPALPELRQHVLTRINVQRAEVGLPPLSLSSCLDDLAQASAFDYARTDVPLGKFKEECAPIWPACSCGWSVEAEVNVAGYGLDWSTAIEHAVVPHRDSPNEELVDAFLSSDVSEVGIGFWLSGDEAWLALSLR